MGKKGIKGRRTNKDPADLKRRIRELERQLRDKDREIETYRQKIAEEREKTEILKYPCTSSCSHTNEV